MIDDNLKPEDTGDKTPEFNADTQQTPEPKFGQAEVEALLKQNSSGQEFIEVLKGETATLRDEVKGLQQELANKKSMEDMIEDIRQQDPNSPDPTGPQLDENKLLDKMREQVSAEMSFAQQLAAEQSNMAVVTAELESRHGEKYASYVDLRAKELGMTNQDMEVLARSKPKAFMELVSPGAASSIHSTPSQSQPQESGEDVAGKEYDRINRLRREFTPEGREAKQRWDDPDFQSLHRARIIAKAEAEGKF